MSEAAQSYYGGILGLAMTPEAIAARQAAGAASRNADVRHGRPYGSLRYAIPKPSKPLFQISAFSILGANHNGFV